MEEKAVGLGLVGSAEIYCEIARRELTAVLQGGVSPEDLGEDFTLAGALYATALSLETQGVDGFTAGEFTLRPDGNAANRAAALRKAAEAMLSGYTVDGDFTFLGVPG